MRVSKRVVRAAVAGMLVPALVAAQGCSLFQPHEQPLTVIPSDQSAEVYVNGRLIGTGTQTVKVKRGKDYAVMAKVGDRAGTAHVGRKISGTGVADIIGGFIILFPFLGALSPGFWDLNPQRVSVALPPGYGPAPYSGSGNYGGYGNYGGSGNSSGSGNFTGRVNPNPGVNAAPRPAPAPRNTTTGDGSRLPPRRTN